MNENKGKRRSTLRRKAGGKRLFKKRTYKDKGETLKPVELEEQEETTDFSVSSTPPSYISTSSKKLNISSNMARYETTSDIEESSDDLFLPSTYLLLDSDILKSIIELVGACPNCNHRAVQVESDKLLKQGLSMLLYFVCDSCGWKKSFYTSKRTKRTAAGNGNQPFEINIRAVIAMREIGKGYNGLSLFCGFMNMTPPMQIKAFNEMQHNIMLAYKNVAESSMRRAAYELRVAQCSNDQDDDNVSADVTVSCDGTWQRRGYASLNGVVTVIAADTGKCVDYRVRSKQCAACVSWEPRKDSEPELYDAFISSHNCDINHEGSSGSMEVSGLVECFLESVANRQLRYTKYIGDGDTKSYSEVVKSDPYPGTVVEKLECVGHIQKRVGGRLRKLKAANKAPLSDGKPLGGKGRLTEKVINKLQNYFGIAVRQCTGTTVYQLKKAIGAVLYHCSDASDLDFRHRMCPRTSDSWCHYQADRLNGTSTYKETPGIPEIIREAIKPVFLDLSDDKLLSKCLHGKTQNNNESINGVIWKRCPKDVYVGRSTIEMGVASAVISFNDGLSSVVKVYEELNVIPGDFTFEFCSKKDTSRVTVMERKSSVEVKKRRKHLRAVKKGFIDTTEEKEGLVYGAGLF